MCEVLDRIENRGIEKGRSEGYAEGNLDGQIKGMTMVYYNKLHYSADQIAQELSTPVDKIQEIIDDLAQ